MSASAYAAFEQPAPRVGVPKPAEFADRLAAVRTGGRASAQPRFWTDMDVSVRMVLVMLGCGQAGNPERIARQPWDSFSAADQQAMASTARLIVANLKPFAAVA